MMSFVIAPALTGKISDTTGSESHGLLYCRRDFTNWHDSFMLVNLKRRAVRLIIKTTQTYLSLNKFALFYF